MTERFPILVQLSNALSIGDDGWAMLAPFGDHPGVAFTKDGRRDAIQRVTRETGEALRASLRSFTGKASRFFRSVPIYNGHPDVPELGATFAGDTTTKGIVGDLQVRDDGIYVLPVFNDAGAALVNGGTRLGLSAYVEAAVTGEEDGKLVTEWSKLRSVGMTPHPNLPVELLNSREGGDDGAKNPKDTMTPELIAALAAAGIQIANASATDAVAGIRTLQERMNAAVTAANAKDGEIADLKKDRDAHKAKADELAVNLANEQDARRKDLLDERVTSGAITEAERALWDGRLKANFANEAASLRALAGKVKTQGTLKEAGNRRGADGDPATSEAFIANVGQLVKGGKSQAEAVRSTIVAIPNSYAAWIQAGCPKF